MAKKTPPRTKALQVKWHVPDDIQAHYASNIVVQRLENEFLVSFFEVRPPIILGSPEEIEAKVKGLELINANCVAQIIIAEKKMPEFVKVLQTNLERGIVHRSIAKDKK